MGFSLRHDTEMTIRDVLADNFALLRGRVPSLSKLPDIVKAGGGTNGTLGRIPLKQTGVSGGPVLYATEADGVQAVGVMTAYRANRAYGDSLPGLSIAQDVSHFHGVVQHIRSIDEGRRKRAEIEAPQ